MDNFVESDEISIELYHAFGVEASSLFGGRFQYKILDYSDFFDVKYVGVGLCSTPMFCENLLRINSQSEFFSTPPQCFAKISVE